MHNHDHHDHHLEMGKKFLLGIMLNFVFVIIELGYGWQINSLSLLADAWHNLGDVAGLIISWFAFKMATKSPSKNYTYGYSKGTILASLANCILLFIAISSMGIDAVQRFSAPQIPDGKIVSLVAGIGVLVNSMTAMIFMRSNELNNRAAFLHMAADALVSLAVVIGGLVMSSWKLPWLDPVLGLMICVLILWGTWNLFRSSLRLSLDGVPESVNSEEVMNAMLAVNGVLEVGDFHLWAISTTRNAVTARISLDPAISLVQHDEIISQLRQDLRSFNINHVTIEAVSKQ